MQVRLFLATGDEAAKAEPQNVGPELSCILFEPKLWNIWAESLELRTFTLNFSIILQLKPASETINFQAKLETAERVTCHV